MSCKWKIQGLNYNWVTTTGNKTFKKILCFRRLFHVFLWMERIWNFWSLDWGLLSTTRYTETCWFGLGFLWLYMDLLSKYFFLNFFDDSVIQVACDMWFPCPKVLIICLRIQVQHIFRVCNYSSTIYKIMDIHINKNMIHTLRLQKMSCSWLPLSNELVTWF